MVNPGQEAFSKNVLTDLIRLLLIRLPAKVASDDQAVIDTTSKTLD
jgi:hypothetical protein